MLGLRCLCLEQCTPSARTRPIHRPCRYHRQHQPPGPRGATPPAHHAHVSVLRTDAAGRLHLLPARPKAAPPRVSGPQRRAHPGPWWGRWVFWCWALWAAICCLPCCVRWRGARCLAWARAVRGRFTRWLNRPARTGPTCFFCCGACWRLATRCMSRSGSGCGHKGLAPGQNACGVRREHHRPRSGCLARAQACCACR